MKEIRVKAKFWSYFQKEEIKSGKISPIEVDSKIDSGSAKVVLPGYIAKKLVLSKWKSITVKYADERRAKRDLFWGLVVEIDGRDTVTTCTVEPKRRIPLIGSIVLEDMDWWIDMKGGKLIPNPESPDEPLFAIE